MTSIFDKDSFTLKELCGLFKNNDISECYINFSSANNNYRHFLNKARNTKENILYSDEYKKYISFREILQCFDPEFNKLIIKSHLLEDEFISIIKQEEDIVNIPIRDKAFSDYDFSINDIKYECKLDTNLTKNNTMF